MQDICCHLDASFHHILQEAHDMADALTKEGVFHDSISFDIYYCLIALFTLFSCIHFIVVLLFPGWAEFFFFYFFSSLPPFQSNKFLAIKKKLKKNFKVHLYQ